MDLVAENRRPAMTSTERRTVALILVLMAILSFWLASNRTFDPVYIQPDEPFNTDFYRQQAISMLNGRLDVPYNQFQFTECFFRESRCYGYFGLVPSILRLPGFVLTGSTDFNPSPIIIAAGVTIALWAAIDLALGIAGADPSNQRLNAASRMRLIVYTALLLGPGGLLVFLSQAKIYYEAEVLMIAALLVSFCLVLRWILHRQPSHLLLALLAGVVATNSRPAALLPLIVLGGGVVLIALRRRTERTRNEVILGAGLAAVPTVSALGVFWLKLRTLTPSFEQYQGYSGGVMQSLLRANDGALQGLRFLPTNLINFLRPDTLGIQKQWPWIYHAVPFDKQALVLPPMTQAGLYVEFSASLTNTMPVPFLLTVGFIILLAVGVVRLTTEQWQIFGLLLVAAAAATAAVLTSFALTTRYLGDFFPLVVVGCVFALVSLLHYLEGRVLATRVMTAVVVLSSIATFIINLSLHQWAFLTAG